MSVKVDPAYSFAFTAPVTPEHDALAAVKAAYNACAAIFQKGGRKPAMVEVRVYAAPKDAR